MRVPAIYGVDIFDTTVHRDDRGDFFRAFDGETMLAEASGQVVVQASVSRNRIKGTLRGLHYLEPDACETKFVTCISGAVWDVAVDMREGSPTFLDYMAIRLGGGNPQTIRLSPGIAHGFLSLQADSTLLYCMTARYTPDLEMGIRWDDPVLGIDWPHSPTIVSPKDLRWSHL